MKYKIRCYDALEVDKTFLKEVDGDLLKIEGFETFNFGITPSTFFDETSYDVTELITGYRVVSGNTRSMAISNLHAKLLEQGVNGFNTRIIAILTECGIANNIPMILKRERKLANQRARA